MNTDWKDEIDETEHLLSSEKNKEHLEESIEQAEEIEKTFQGSEGFLEEQVNLGFKEIEIEEKEDLLDKATKQNEIIQRFRKEFKYKTEEIIKYLNIKRKK